MSIADTTNSHWNRQFYSSQKINVIISNEVKLFENNEGSCEFENIDRSVIKMLTSKYPIEMNQKAIPVLVTNDDNGNYNGIDNRCQPIRPMKLTDIYYRDT